MDDLIGIVVTAVLWMIFRSVGGNAKKQKAQQTRPGSAPKEPARPTGGWADILGVPSEHMPPTFREAMQRIGSAFEVEEEEQPAPAAATPAQSEIRSMELTNGSASSEGVDFCHDTLYSTPPSSLLGEEGADDCHDSMLPPAYRRAAEESHPNAPLLPGWSLRLDAPSLVQGVVLSEILTRPAMRRRDHAWRSR